MSALHLEACRSLVNFILLKILTRVLRDINCIFVFTLGRVANVLNNLYFGCVKDYGSAHCFMLSRSPALMCDLFLRPVAGCKPQLSYVLS